MISAEYDLRYLEAGLEEMEKYLLSSEIFWHMGAKPPAGEPDYPQLTLEWLLLAATRLEGRDLIGEQKEQVESAINTLDLNRTKWRVAWEKKAGQCYQMRGRMWRGFLRGYKGTHQKKR